MRHDQSVRVIEVLTDRLVQVVQLPLTGYASLQDLGAHAPYKVGAHCAAGMTGRVDVCLCLDADIDEASLPEQFGQTTTDKQVRVVRPVRGPENLTQPVPRRMRRVAQAAAHVRFQRRDPAAGPDQPHHLSDHHGRVRNVDQQGAGVHEVERGWRQARTPGISFGDVRVGQPMLVSERAGHSDVDRVNVQPGHMAVRPHPFGQQVNDPAGAASQVNRVPPALDADPVQKRGTVGTKLFGLAPQPVAFRGAGPQGVDRSFQRRRVPLIDRPGHAAMVSAWSVPRKHENELMADGHAVELCLRPGLAAGYPLSAEAGSPLPVCTSRRTANLLPQKALRLLQ